LNLYQYKKALAGDKVFVTFDQRAIQSREMSSLLLAVLNSSGILMTGKPMGYLVLMKGTVYVKSPFKGIYSRRWARPFLKYSSTISSCPW
jgi:hypothetical protein